jgi:2-polyprenyl-3-methyl-5-hydroxy-6-metoxy-1,4-benzoquinol methylase
MAKDDVQRSNEETRAAWEGNAAYWDERMGEGNDFVNVLIWPAVQRLLELQPGQRVLDAACGNGLYARRLATLGAEVVAFDFSANLIEFARKRSRQDEPIEYHVLDATDETALLELGTGRFDAALCSMALFDIADIYPLLRALAVLLKPGGHFVFSVLHPCFNSSDVVHVAEMEDRDGQLVTTYGMKIRRYLTPCTIRAAAIPGQPQAQLIFHRSLQDLFGAAFQAGFILDALEERAFPPDHAPGGNPLGWSGRFSEIPPVLVGRLRTRA